MPRLVNAYSIHSEDLQPGDEMCFVVKAMVTYRGHDGVLHYRLYRCPWEGNIENMPQGDWLGNREAIVCQELFPSLARVAKTE